MKNYIYNYKCDFMKFLHFSYFYYVISYIYILYIYIVVSS